MSDDFAPQPISGDAFRNLSYPEGGVLVLIFTLFTIVASVVGNVILGYDHKPFYCLIWYPT